MNEYLYRVDDLRDLRRLKTQLTPRIWDLFPHASLVEAAPNVPSDQAIVRISFWLSEFIARQSGLKDSGPLQQLSRIRRQHVERAFAGWTFEEDDHLPKRALLVWRVADRSETDGDFMLQGLDSRAFEIFEDGRWVAWDRAYGIRPLRDRLLPAGWNTVWNRDRNQILQPVSYREDRLPSDRTQLVLMLAFDPDSGGQHLASNPDGIAQLVQLITAGGGRSGALPGHVLLAAPSHSEHSPSIWTTTFLIHWHRQEASGWRGVACRALGVRTEELSPTLQEGGALSAQDASELLRRSGLLSAQTLRPFV